MSFTIELGKYTYEFKSNGESAAFCHGEYWRDMTGDGFVLAMAHRIQELDEELHFYKEKVNDLEDELAMLYAGEGRR